MIRIFFVASYFGGCKIDFTPKMSSPAVITWEKVPLEHARQMNQQGARHFLDLASRAIEAIEKRAQAISTRGYPVVRPHIESIEAAQQKLGRMLGEGGDLSGALSYAHNYFQRAKHPWSEIIEQAEAKEIEDGQLRVEVARSATLTHLTEAEVEAARQRSLSRLSSISISGEVRQVGNLKAGRERETPQEAVANWAQEYRVLAVGNGRLDIAERNLHEWKESKCEIALERIRFSVKAESELTQTRLNNEARMRALERRRETVRSELGTSIQCLEKCFGEIPETLAAEYRASIASLTKRLSNENPDDIAILFEGVRSAIFQCVGGAKSAHALVNALKALGYTEVHTMGTLTAQQVRSTFLAIPGGASRFLEVAWDVKGSSLAVEVVRETPGNGTESQRLADVAAQERACNDFTSASETIRAKHPFRLQKRVAPGALVKQKTIRRSSQGEQGTSSANQSVMHVKPQL